MISVKLGGENYQVGKIVCVGRNYVEHARELGNEVPEFPLIFLKPPSNIIFSGGKIVQPDYSNDMHHEVELVLLIGEDVKCVSADEAENSIAGYTAGLDMTLRDIQDKLKSKGHPWTLAKCFDGSAVLGEFVSMKQLPLNLDSRLSLSVNGKEKQNSDLNKMIFKPNDIVSYISSVMKLERGDLIFTGTPAGVGKVKKGDIIDAALGGAAELTVAVI